MAQADVAACDRGGEQDDEYQRGSSLDHLGLTTGRYLFSSVDTE